MERALMPVERIEILESLVKQLRISNRKLRERLEDIEAMIPMFREVEKVAHKCLGCRKIFYPNRKNQMYCSLGCSNRRRAREFYARHSKKTNQKSDLRRDSETNGAEDYVYSGQSRSSNSP